MTRVRRLAAFASMLLVFILCGCSRTDRGTVAPAGPPNSLRLPNDPDKVEAALDFITHDISVADTRNVTEARYFLSLNPAKIGTTRMGSYPFDKRETFRVNFEIHYAEGTVEQQDVGLIVRVLVKNDGADCMSLRLLWEKDGWVTELGGRSFPSKEFLEELGRQWIRQLMSPTSQPR